jgi:type II secretory pathway component PulC
LAAGCAGRAPIQGPGAWNSAENVTPLFMSADLQRIEHGGKVSAVRISSIARGSSWEAAGFQDGDEITAINGKPIQEPDDFFRLLEAMARPQTSVVELNRRSAPGQPPHPESLRVRAAE